MKLEGALPIPSMTVTLLPAVGRAPRDVVVHGERGWQARIAAPRLTQKHTHHCTSCGGAGHNRASTKCPARKAP